jgi:hypothetical protein
MFLLCFLADTNVEVYTYKDRSHLVTHKGGTGRLHLLPLLLLLLQLPLLLFSSY